VSEPDIPPSPAASAPTAAAPRGRWLLLALAVTSIGALWLAWNVQEKVHALELELVKRQQRSQEVALASQALSKQAQELVRENSTRTAQLETRLNELAAQRGEVDEWLKATGAARPDALAIDVDADIRAAVQQASLTGSAEPLVSALQAASARLEQTRRPRLDGVRRALARDLDRLRATPLADLDALTRRIDQGIRMIDELPLLSQPVDAQGLPLKQPTVLTPPAHASAPEAASPGSAAASAPSDAAEAAAPDTPFSGERLWHLGRQAAHTIWDEAQSLVRITRIRQPDAVLLAPDQAFFVRENLKLRLLNARLALLSRQSNTAVADLNSVLNALDKYFDPQSRKTLLLRALLSDVSAQSANITIPRPDDTLSALAALTEPAAKPR